MRIVQLKRRIGRLEDENSYLMNGKVKFWEQSGIIVVWQVL